MVSESEEVIMCPEDADFSKAVKVTLYLKSQGKAKKERIRLLHNNLISNLFFFLNVKGVGAIFFHENKIKKTLKSKYFRKLYQEQ